MYNARICGINVLTGTHTCKVILSLDSGSNYSDTEYSIHTVCKNLENFELGNFFKKLSEVTDSKSTNDIIGKHVRVRVEDGVTTLIHIIYSTELEI